MKYLCLVYCEEAKLDALSRSEYDALVVEARHMQVELSEIVDLIRERHRAMQSKD